VARRGFEARLTKYAAFQVGDGGLSASPISSLDRPPRPAHC
jgi:hypothetical protein